MYAIYLIKVPVDGWTEHSMVQVEASERSYIDKHTRRSDDTKHQQIPRVIHSAINFGKSCNLAPNP
jgi:hypothetical protein